MQEFICLCTPTLGQVSIEWSCAVKSLLWPMNVGFVQVVVKDDVGGEIAESRNRCVAQAFAFENHARKVSHLMWLDDDVIPDRSAVIQLLSWRMPIVTGAYYAKYQPSEPLLLKERGCGTHQYVPGEAFEVWGHGMGLCLVNMDVYRKLMPSAPADKYGNREFYRTLGPGSLEEDGETVLTCQSEDLSFVEFYRDFGYKAWADCSKEAFGWHYDAGLKAAYPLRQWFEQQRGEKPRFATEKGIKAWD